MLGRLIPVLAFVLASAACSSSTDTGGTTPPTGGTDAAAATDSGGSSPSSLKAPVITMVMQMEGALHVMWTNAETSCDSIEGERKSNGSYASAFSVPGTVDNKMDAKATDNMTYTYRIRCKKGTAYSAYSNEMGGNPMTGMDMDGGMNMDSGMGMD